MRCYSIRGGHIVFVKELPGLSDEAVEGSSQVVFGTPAPESVDGFEVWERTCAIVRHPPSESGSIQPEDLASDDE
jgi:hypothetical protein